MSGGVRHSPVALAGLVAGLVGTVAIASLAETATSARESRIVADQQAIHAALRRHALRAGSLPGSLAELDDEALGPAPRDPWGQPWLYLPRRDARGHVTEYALVSLGPEGGRHELRVDWSDRPGERIERAPSGVGVSRLLPPLLSAVLAGGLGLVVWRLARMPVWRRAAALESPPLWPSAAPAGPRVALHRAPSALHCAWCHDAPGELPLLACAGCGTVLHAECWSLALRCPTLGCRRRAPASRGLRRAASMAWVDPSEPVDAVPGGPA